MQHIIWNQEKVHYNKRSTIQNVHNNGTWVYSDNITSQAEQMRAELVKDVSQNAEQTKFCSNEALLHQNCLLSIGFFSQSFYHQKRENILLI